MRWIRCQWARRGLHVSPAQQHKQSARDNSAGGKSASGKSASGKHADYAGECPDQLAGSPTQYTTSYARGEKRQAWRSL
jgi:hypothetical protein